MTSYKKALLSKFFPALILSVFLPSSCSHENELASGESLDFPLDDKGCPENNLVLVSGKAHPMNLVGGIHTGSEIKVKIDERKDGLKIDLPQYLPINTWNFEEETYLNITSYSRVAYPMKKENMLERSSLNVQNFKIQLLEGEGIDLVFKWANVNETDKLFKNKQGDYLLKITLLD